MTLDTNSVLMRLRGGLLAILFLGMAGAAAELWLAGHTEDLWQWVPLALLGAGFVIAIWCAAAANAAAIRSLQLVMILFIASGFAGIALHMRAKMEFKQESDPSLTGWRLLVGSLESKTPPPLAPAAMIHLGLIGLLYAYRHPALFRARKPSDVTES